LPWSSRLAWLRPRANAYAFDLGKPALLTQAGISSLELDIIGIVNGYPLLETFMQAYQADLAKLNVNNIKTMDGAQWLDRPTITNTPACTTQATTTYRQSGHACGRDNRAGDVGINNRLG
jgi:hypothetical protein